MELVEYVYPGAPVSFFNYVEHPVFGRINELAELENGWHFGSGDAPSRRVLTFAKILATYAVSLSLPEIDAFPGKNGEVTIAIYLGEEDHSFQVRRDSSFRYWSESNPDSEIEEGLSFKDVIQKIAEIARAHPPSWNLFYTSTFDIGTRKSGIFVARPSKTPAMEVVYPWSISTAYGAGRADLYVNTLEGFTQPLALNPRFSGNLTNQSCLQDTA